MLVDCGAGRLRRIQWAGVLRSLCKDLGNVIAKALRSRFIDRELVDLFDLNQ